jgi:hypothetical protein
MTTRFEHYWLKDEAKGVAGGFRCKTVPHIMLRTITKLDALDPVFAKHDPILAARLADLNAALANIGSSQRNELLGKLSAKQKTEGKRSVTDADRRRWDLPKLPQGFQHWTAPFDTDPDHPAELIQAITAYRAAWRAKQNDVDKTIADAAEGAVWWVFGDPRLALAVAGALAAAGTIATGVGFLLPWVFHRAGLDPALGSGPVATVVQDVLSLAVYLGLVRLLLT